MQRVDPDKLYAFSEAAKLIPSSRGGHVALKTLHDWRRAGLIRAEVRQLRTLKHWFVRGSEILRISGEGWKWEPVHLKEPITRTRNQHERAQKEALKELRRMGIGTGGEISNVDR